MVLHGPEVFDQGDVAWLLERLVPRRTLVAGAMARTAAEESGLPVEYSGEPPSVLIKKLEGRVFLVNRGKTPYSGRIFGEIVAHRLRKMGGLVHVECSSRTIYLWNDADTVLGEELAAQTGFHTITLTSSGTSTPKRREIRGCLPGEAVCINGIVIGHAVTDTVVLELVDGKIIPVSGLMVKDHGFEKLEGKVIDDLAAAWCKSGKIRSRPPVRCLSEKREGRVVVIDHCGHDIFRQLGSDVCGVLAIGDDTTAVCGHICSHLGIPVFGIVDGDADHLIEGGFAPGSIIVEVREGRDDELGREVAKSLSGDLVQWDEWTSQAKERLKGRTRILKEVKN